MAVELKQLGDIAYREALPPGAGQDAPAALFIHGYPQSSYMWVDLLPAIAAAGWRAIAPDMPGFGNSPPIRESTWDRHVETVESFRQGLGLERIALVVHDWGGMIGLRWACEHPDAVRALVISCTHFFPDFQWHRLGRTLRTEGKGEAFVANVTREGLGSELGEMSPGMRQDAIDDYFKAYADDDRRRAQLELWRSADQERLAPYHPLRDQLRMPTLVLWGENDEFAGLDIAQRFHRDLPGSRLVVVPGAGHFVFEDEPERTSREIATFLAGV